MSKRQTRRSLSIRGSLYRRLAVLCEQEDRSVSARVEEAIEPLVAGIPDPGVGNEPRVRKHDRGPNDPRSRKPDHAPSEPSRPRQPVTFDDLDALKYAFGPRFT